MKYYIIFCVLFLGLLNSIFAQNSDVISTREKFSNIEFLYDTISGIGYEKGCTRRDPSDIIKVGGTCYVYYTKIYGRAAGYWGTI